MIVIINKQTGYVVATISGSNIPQELQKDEMQLQVDDMFIIEALSRGDIVRYDVDDGAFVIDERNLPPTEIELLQNYVLENDMRLVMLEFGF